MHQVLCIPQRSLFFNNANPNTIIALKIPSRKSCFRSRNRSLYEINRCRQLLFSSPVSKSVNQAEHATVVKDPVCDGGQFTAFPHIQSLRSFPKEELFGKVVMVRFDAMILFQGMKEHLPSSTNAFSTIKYLYGAGAKVILVGSWNENITSSSFLSEACTSAESVADFLSLMLEIKVVPVKHVLGYMHSDVEDRTGILLIENLFLFKGERANCSKFAQELTSGVDIIVNDAFSESHKVLASTVGVARFCYAYIAGFHFEEGLSKLKKIMETSERPYVAIVLLYSLL